MCSYKHHLLGQHIIQFLMWHVNRVNGHTAALASTGIPHNNVVASDLLDTDQCEFVVVERAQEKPLVFSKRAVDDGTSKDNIIIGLEFVDCYELG